MADDLETTPATRRGHNVRKRNADAAEGAASVGAIRW